MKRGSLPWVLACGTLAIPRASLACSCVPSPPGLTEEQLVARARDTSTAVFSAKVVTLEPASGAIAVHLKPDRVFKGSLVGEVVVRTGRGGGDCGYRFQLGESYLVYAFGASEGALGTSRCTRTRTLEQAAPDIRTLGGSHSVKR